MLGRVPIPPLVMCMTFSLRTEKGETDAQINADNCAGGGGGQNKNNFVIWYYCEFFVACMILSCIRF